MGYRWECATCNEPYTIYQIVRPIENPNVAVWMNDKDAKEHQKQNPTHRVWGGYKYWKYPDGLHIQRIRKVTEVEQGLWKEYCKEIKLLVKHKHHFHLYFTTEDGWKMYKEGRYERPELEETKSNRKHKPPSKKQGYPECGESKNIRYVSKGKLKCTSCDIVFKKGDKK